MLGLLALSGCGFAPAYGTGGAAQVLRGAVDVSAPDTIPGFQLAARLSDRLGPVAAPRFALSVTLDLNQSAAAINVEGDTTRFNLVGSAPWVLTEAGSGATLLTGTARSFASYSAIGSTVATQTAADDAQTRLATVLADLIVADLTARASQLP